MKRAAWSEAAVLVLLTLAAAGLRLHDLGRLPLGAAGTEEGTSWLITAAVLEKGWPVLPSGLGYWKGLPYTLLASAAALVFGHSAWALRLPSALAGTAAVALAWWAARAIAVRLGAGAGPAAVSGFLAAYIMAFSQWSLLMSRWGRFYALGQVLFLAGVACAAAGFSGAGRPSRGGAANRGSRRDVLGHSLTGDSSTRATLQSTRAEPAWSAGAGRILPPDAEGPSRHTTDAALATSSAGRARTTPPDAEGPSRHPTDAAPATSSADQARTLPPDAEGPSRHPTDAGLATSFGSACRPARWSAAAFGAVLLLGVATFHAGGLLLLAIAAALLMGVRFTPGQRRVLAASAAGAGAWYAGVFFFWRSGHVESASGWSDLVLLAGPPLWKHTLVLVPASLAAWALILRERRGARRAGWILLVLLLAIEAILLVGAGIKGVDTGALRGFQVLAEGHPGLMLLAFLGTSALLLLAPLASREARIAAGLLWILTVVPIAIVGASTGNFVPRYLLFAVGPLAVSAALVPGLILARIPIPAARAIAAALLLPLAMAALAPAVSPAGALTLVAKGIGDRWPPLFACSPTRPYALDLESPSRFVAERLAPDDLVVATDRSIPEAVIGRMDYLFRPPTPANALPGEAAPLSVLTGSPMVSRVEEVLALSATRRVFVILDERAMRMREVRELGEALMRARGRPDFEAAGGYARVFVLPAGFTITDLPDSRGS